MLPSLTKQALRYLLVGIVALIIVASLVLLFQAETDEDRLTAFIGLLTGIFSVLAAPPLADVVDQAFFEANNTGAEDVRKRLKAYWIRQYLRAEQRAISGASRPPNQEAYNPNGAGGTNGNDHDEEEEEEVPDPHACDLRTHLTGIAPGAFSNYGIFEPALGRFKFKTKSETESVDISNHLYPTITDADTLSTFFDKFTRYVENDWDYTGEFIILMGERGTRKTVKLLELAEHLVDRTTRVPVYANLFSWSAGCKQIEVWLQEEIMRQYNIVGWKAKRLIENNYLILLLDGFEEVPHERRRHLVKAIENFLDNRLHRRSTPVASRQGERPVDLRDGLVIAVKTPSEIERLDDHVEDTNVSLSDDTDNYVDLFEHVEELLDALQGISTGGNPSPVAVLRIEPLSPAVVRDYLLCQFRRKVREVENAHTAALMPSQKPEDRERREQDIERQATAVANKTQMVLEDMQAIELLKLVKWPELRDILRSSPFLLRAFISTFYYDRNAGEMRSSFDLISGTEKASLRSKLENMSSTAERYKILQEVIIHRYVQQSLRHQPDNIGPHGSVERDKLLEEMATAMQRRRQRVLDDGDVVFYLEDIGLRMLIQKNPRRMLQYKGLVALVTSVIFTLVYLAFALIVQDMRPEVTLLVGVLIVLFGRSFGWQSCGKPNEDRTELTYPLRWFADAGLGAAIFMAFIVGMVFFEMTRIVYEGVNQPPLLYESVVSGLFAFSLFLFMGGLELGRRYDVVARPYEGRRFLLITTLMSGGLWFVFFFLFMFWPRARFELLTNIQIQELVPAAGLYAAIAGTFIGFISGFVLSHLYLRHLVLYWYLGLQRGLRSQYSQVLDHNARPEIGILRKLGGGYVFRHRFIMNYFRKDYQGSLDR